MAADRNKVLVAWSSPESLQKEQLSLLACFEVAASIACYILLAGFLHSQPHLWFSILVVPLFLLRSPNSVSLSVSKFESYVDRLFKQERAEDAWRSWQFWMIALFGNATIGLSAFLLSDYMLSTSLTLVRVMLFAFIGYLAAVFGFSLVIATNVRLVVAVAQRPMLAILPGIMAPIAAGVGVALATANPAATISATSAILILGLVAAFEIPRAAKEAAKQAAAELTGDAKGLAFVRAARKLAPISMSLFAPGCFLGGFLRSSWIRFVANISFFRDGCANLPRNYWRLLFVLDIRHKPELLPGYRRSDPANFSFILSRLRTSRHRFIYGLGLIVLYFPGYSYRFYIKSTCWLYYGLVYLTRPFKLSANPDYLVELLRGDPREWTRRIWAIATLIGVIVVNIWTAQRVKDLLPPSVISPLEYLVLIDLGKIRPWQWFSMFSAAITIYLFLFRYEVATMLRHQQTDARLRRLAQRRAWWFELAMRARELSTQLYLVMAILHLMLAISPLQTYLHPYALRLLSEFYGDAMPNPSSNRATAP